MKNEIDFLGIATVHNQLACQFEKTLKQLQDVDELAHVVVELRYAIEHHKHFAYWLADRWTAEIADEIKDAKSPMNRNRSEHCGCPNQNGDEA